jgi:hypothetical protein
MMPERTPRVEESVRADVVEALANLNSDTSIARVQRTRRAMRAAALEMVERRRRQRRALGFALLAFLSILLFLGPAIWNSVEDLLMGEHFADLAGQVTMSLVLLFPAVLAALIASWKGQRLHDRRTV